MFLNVEKVFMKISEKKTLIRFLVVFLHIFEIKG